MNEHLNQLTSYIKQCIAQGVPEDVIRHTLLQHNWDLGLVDQAFAVVKTPPQASYVNPIPEPQAWNAQPHPAEQQPVTGSAPQKYKLFRSLADAFRAIRNNAVTFLLAVVLSCVFAGVSLLLVSLIATAVLYSGTGPLFASVSKTVTVLFGSLILYTAWYALAYAFVLVSTSLAVYDGSEGRKRSIGATISVSFAKVGRVALTNMLVALAAAWPMAILLLMPIILLMGVDAGGVVSLILVPIILVAAIVWMCIASVRFALAPYVALFEPNVPVIKTLGRSTQLLRKGGQWFLVKGIMLLLPIVLLVAAITGNNLTELRDSNGVAVNALVAVITIISNAVLVMLYRNRKQVRG